MRWNPLEFFNRSNANTVTVDAGELERLKDFNRQAVAHIRAFKAVTLNGANARWNPMRVGVNGELAYSIPALVGKARDLEHNNDFVLGHLDSLETNVIGHNGVKIQCKVKDRNGNLRQEVNKLVESYIKRWSKKQYCDITRRRTFRDICRQAVRSLERDGEILVVKIRNAKTPFRFALKLVNCDLLDEKFTTLLANGNRVVMGVEIDDDNAPVAFWIRKENYSSYLHSNYHTAGERERILADDVIHFYRPTNVDQLRGLTHLHTIMVTLHNQDGYVDAEVIARRASSSKMGFIIDSHDDTDEELGTTTNAAGATEEAVAPGTIRRTNGTKFEAFDPGHHTDIGVFTKMINKSASAAVGTSYPTWSNDLTETSFSSIRQGGIKERDNYRMLQQYVIDHFVEPIIEEAVAYGFATNSIGLPLHMMEEVIASLEYSGRVWESVDMLKEMKGYQTANEMGAMPLSDIVARISDRDFEDVVDLMKFEKDLLEKNGLVEFLTALVNEKSKTNKKEEEDAE